MGMLLPLLSLVLVAVSHGAYYEDTFAKLHDEIQAKTSLWKAGYNKRFEGMSKEELVRMMGARLDEPEDAPKKWILNIDQNLPDTFDARKQWPQCKNRIDFIRDQSACGACWACSSAEVMTDRTCIQSNGTETPYLSDEDIVDCSGPPDGGCGGGFPLLAFRFWNKKGVVTGGPYGSTDGCLPYSINPKAHQASTPDCTKKCIPEYTTDSYKEDKHFGKSYFLIKGGAKGMQQELFDNGPIVAGFDVYADFSSYETGVYHHVSGDWLGGHAVKVIGWGTEDNTPYWLAANSWNASWGGLDGYFKIKRGSDECKFESSPSAGAAK